MNSPAPQERSTVIVVDDDDSVREALDSLLRSAGLRVETYSSAREFLKGDLPNTPACLVLDVSLPDLNGLQVQHELAAAGCHLPIIFITGHGDIPMSVKAMKAGAVEFLTKPFRDQELLDAIHAALERHRNALKQQAELSDLRAHYDALSPREREVMELVVRGMLNKQIAAQLGTAEITVKVQRSGVMKKMQAASLADLVRMAGMLQRGNTDHTKV